MPENTRDGAQFTRFAGHGSICEADDDRGTDFGRCGEAAWWVVSYNGLDRCVCRAHFNRLDPRLIGKVRPSK